MKPKITLNEDKELVAKIREGLKAKDGYCPCRIPKTEEFKCMCKEFLEQKEVGECGCGLYYKVEV